MHFLCRDALFLSRNVIHARPEDAVRRVYHKSIAKSNASISMQDAVADLVAPWVIAFAVAVVVSMIAMFMRVKVFFEQLRCATTSTDFCDDSC